MLSSQTKDEQNAKTMATLKAYGLTPEKIYKTDEEKLKELIYGVGFHNKKTKYIKEATRRIIEDNKGQVPDSLPEVLKLPGVGSKMAMLLMQGPFEKVLGISVDTHVHRIANRLKWVKTRSPE